MKVRYYDDTLRGPGCGALVCEEGDFVEGAYDVSLQRASDRNFCAMEGDWQEPEALLRLEGQLDAASSLMLPLPSAVVNTLATTDTYRVTVTPVGSAHRDVGRLTIDAISYSKEGPLGHTVVVADPKKAPEPVVQEPEPQEKAPETSPNEEPPIVLQPPRTPERRQSWLPILLLGVCLLLAGLGFWYYQTTKTEEPEANIQESAKAAKAVPERTPEKTPEKAQAKAPEQKAVPDVQKEKSQNAAPVHAAPAASPKQEAVLPLTVEEEVVRFFKSSDRSGAKAVELAKRLSHTTVAEQDALFRLYYFAGEHGGKDILLDYAACLDPSKPAWGTIEKNAPDAWRIYDKAKADPELAGKAEAAQTALRAWLREEETKGSAKAREWLLQLP